MSTPFEQALLNKTNPAHVRLALYICKKQNKGAFHDANDLQKTLGGLNGAFAGALFDMMNENTASITRNEMSIMYDCFIEAFKKKAFKKNIPIEELHIHLSVDYGPCSAFSDILSESFKRIREQREKNNGPKLPHGWGVGMKCSYISSKGCASFQSYTIDHYGDLLYTDPWKTLYKNDTEENKFLAETLKPNMDSSMQTKFINRAIVNTMGYTFEKDAVHLFEADNVGAVKYLIENVDVLLQKVARQLFEDSVNRYTGRSFTDIALLLLQKGLDITYYGFGNDFLYIIRYGCDSKDILDIITHTVESQDCINIQNDMYFKKSIIESIATRYTMRYIYSTELSLIIKVNALWTKYNIQGCFYTTLLEYIESEKIHIKDSECFLKIINKNKK